MLNSKRKSKNRYFLPQFGFPWGRPWGNHAKCCINRKRIRCLKIVSQHVPIYLQQFPSYSNCKCKKSAIFTYRRPHFCFPWRHPCYYHVICCINGKKIQCLPNPSQHVPIYLQQFPSYTMLKSMRKSKNRYFYHILVSPGDASRAITLNVVWIEREFDAYKLPRSMYPSIFNSFPVIRTASPKNRRFHVPQPTFLFPLETPLRLSRKMLHRWKDNSMLAKPFAARIHLASIVSELYDA